jgi:hypothetical protein
MRAVDNITYEEKVQALLQLSNSPELREAIVSMLTTCTPF